MKRPRTGGGGITLLSAALLTALLTTLLTMPAGAAVNPVNPPVPKAEHLPAVPKVKKLCDGGAEQYQFELVKVGEKVYNDISRGQLGDDGPIDAFTYQNATWARHGDKYFDVTDSDMSHPARIANASAVCRPTIDSATTAEVASSTAWQQVVNRRQTYAQQAAAFNRWHTDHCVPGGRVDCGATYPTLAETCALYPGLELSTGEDC